MFIITDLFYYMYNKVKMGLSFLIKGSESSSAADLCVIENHDGDKNKSDDAGLDPGHGQDS